MGDFSSWLQDNWSDLGTLLTLIAFLVAGVWFVRNLLKTIEKSQDQMGALLKLLVANAANRPLKGSSEEDALPLGISSWLETPTIVRSEPEVIGPDRFALVCRGLLGWLQRPMRAAGGAPRRVVRWLQAPMGG